ncbi:MAG TPA: UDP-N-acetylmuramate--L-alanine ligase [Candidatus Elarobacter sp.]|nr:UDP-N-acetylmuramate--L-alanine ligase [Candidatus Elarobacter sp.]
MTDTAYHLVGVGGIGMSAIARLLLARGARVGGSDVKRTPLIDELAAEGVRVAIGHDSGNVRDAGVVVVSSAIAPDNPELRAAREGSARIVSRGAMLAELAQDHALVAVAGTHGKTTTTAMLATIFETAGLDPTVAVGGVRVDTGTNARAGGSRWFISESDESDGSFLALRPTIAVITNVENDHVTSEDEAARLRAQFAAFANTVTASGRLIAGVDNAACAAIARSTSAPVTTFGLNHGAEITATDVRFEAFGASFTVRRDGAVLGEATLNVPGAINVENALGAIAASLAAGIAFEDAAAGLAAFHGVRRRFEVVGRGALTVVDDYAHHPTAIAATIAAARGIVPGRSVVVAFQPHRYSRTQFLKDDFARALGTADRVYLAPVYAASEAPIPGVSERSIGAPLEASGTPVTYVADVDELIDVVPRDTPDGALVLMLGAGSISSAAHRLGERVAAAPV